MTLIEYLKNLNSSELIEDDYGNLRYIGANPNNYVSFNNELWRIIGVMKDIENEDGTKEEKVKLIRSESIGNYSWDNKGSSGTNNWSTSALQKLLNEGAYWNRTSGDCPYGKNGAIISCNLSNRGLTEESRNMISTSVWNLSGSAYTSNTVRKFYEAERGTTGPSGSPIKWTGNVGLMYPSDYGYATSGGSTTDREACLNTPLNTWSNEGVVDCKNNDWLLFELQWTIMPYSSNSYNVVLGNYTYVGAYNTYRVRPSIYLNSNIINENESNGSSTSPFVLKN